MCEELEESFYLLKDKLKVSSHQTNISKSNNNANINNALKSFVTALISGIPAAKMPISSTPHLPNIPQVFSTQNIKEPQLGIPHI